MQAPRRYDRCRCRGPQRGTTNVPTHATTLSVACPQVAPTATGNSYTPEDVVLPDFVLKEARAAAKVAALADAEAEAQLEGFDPMRSDVPSTVVLDEAGGLVTRQQRAAEHPHQLWVQGSAYLRTGQYVAATRCYGQALIAEQKST